MDDLDWNNTYYAAIMRSPFPHAKIDHIKLKNGKKIPEDAKLIRSSDIPGDNHVHVILDDMPLLADSIVRYVGEPVAIVVAKTQELAHEFLDYIEVKYEPLPHLLDPLVAKNHEKIHIYGENNILAYHRMRKGDFENGFNDRYW